MKLDGLEENFNIVLSLFQQNFVLEFGVKHSKIEVVPNNLSMVCYYRHQPIKY
jgi:hypothetical protein